MTSLKLFIECSSFLATLHKSEFFNMPHEEMEKEGFFNNYLENVAD